MNFLEINRHVNVREDHHHTHHVTERRAPTEESVRLLREMESAARQAVTDAVRVVNCPIEIVVHSMDDVFTQAHMFAIVYSVSGVRRDVRVNVPMGSDRDEVALKVIDALAADIAVTLLAPHMSKLLELRNYKSAP